MRFPITAAELNQRPPAIVQQAKDWRYYEQAILNSEENTGRLFREYKEGGAWKEHYKTWADACEPLGKSRSQVDKMIHFDRLISSERAKVDDNQEQKALSQVEAAREEKEEETEKPAVHSADEKKREEPKPRNNGKPKAALAIWNELEQSLFGRALNRTDELNKQCPNKVFHAQLIACTKSCMAVLENWKESVR